MPKPSPKTLKQEPATVLWWIGWIGLTIASFFVSCAFWTATIAKHVGSMEKSGVPVLWISAVFGTWMLMLLPLIIAMYHKVDKAYEDARLARELALLKNPPSQAPVKSVFVEPSHRLLPNSLKEKLKKMPPILRKSHLVTVRLRDGRRIENVFIRNRQELIGIYDVETLPFQVDEITDLEAADLERNPPLKPERWLRLDGV